MPRCPNGTRKQNGKCVKKSELSKKRCPNGTRKQNGKCVKKSELSRKRCPNGTRKYKGECVKKTSPQKQHSGKYIITIHNQNNTQIKDMDVSIDDPMEFIEQVETTTKCKGIIPMPDMYLPNYIKTMHLSKKDIDDDEFASIWFCECTNHLQSSYNIQHNGKTYIVKFHSI
jgi:hypothetical protein